MPQGCSRRKKRREPTGSRRFLRFSPVLLQALAAGDGAKLQAIPDPLYFKELPNFEPAEGFRFLGSAPRGKLSDASSVGEKRCKTRTQLV